ncbi:uncharacterized protein LOC141906287 [Tubulanus polymorphus]|uniref:uncharacterized protein LOC141906287 n=1 Tax=Tubulanus polymorphus TaxID=672921 RepID=UPI003DA28DB5
MDVYKEGDPVWFKQNGLWWVGRVISEEQCPLATGKRKRHEGIYVKFENEDFFEMVYDVKNIDRFNSSLKDEYIKKTTEYLESRRQDLKLLHFRCALRSLSLLESSSGSTCHLLQTTVSGSGKTSAEMSVESPSITTLSQKRKRRKSTPRKLRPRRSSTNASLPNISEDNNISSENNMQTNSDDSRPNHTNNPDERVKSVSNICCSADVQAEKPSDINFVDASIDSVSNVCRPADIQAEKSVDVNFVGGHVNTPSNICRSADVQAEKSSDVNFVHACVNSVSNFSRSADIRVEKSVDVNAFENVKRTGVSDLNFHSNEQRNNVCVHGHRQNQPSIADSDFESNEQPKNICAMNERNEPSASCQPKNSDFVRSNVRDEETAAATNVKIDHSSGAYVTPSLGRGKGQACAKKSKAKPVLKRKLPVISPPDERLSSFFAIKPTVGKSDGETSGSAFKTPEKYSNNTNSELKLNDDDDNVDKDNGEDESDDDDLPMFSPCTVNEPQFSKGEVVWVNFRNTFHWPALIKNCYAKKRKFVVLFLSDYVEHSSRTGLSITYDPKKKNILPYNDERKKEIIEVGTNSDRQRDFATAWQAADDYFTKKALGHVNVSSFEYFAELDLIPVANKLSVSNDQLLDLNDDLLSDDPQSSRVDGDENEEGVKPLECVDFNENTAGNLPQRIQKTLDLQYEKRKKRNQDLVTFIQTDPAVKKHLFEIYNGTFKSEIHERYQKDPGSVKYEGSGPIDDEDQLEALSLTLGKWHQELLSSKEDKPAIPQAGYVLSVWLPEAIVYGMRRKRRCSTKKAWEIFRNGVRMTNASSAAVHKQMTESVDENDMNLYKEKFEFKIKMKLLSNSML